MNTPRDAIQWLHQMFRQAKRRAESSGRRLNTLFNSHKLGASPFDQIYNWWTQVRFVRPLIHHYDQWADFSGELTSLLVHKVMLVSLLLRHRRRSITRCLTRLNQNHHSNLRAGFTWNWRYRRSEHAERIAIEVGEREPVRLCVMGQKFLRVKIWIRQVVCRNHTLVNVLLW